MIQPTQACNQASGPQAPRNARCANPALRAAAAALLALGLFAAAPAAGYIGPGAGFAVASSFMVFFATILVAIGVLLIWPFRTAYKIIRRKKPAKSFVKRFIVVGLDGQDPKITDQLMAEGKLPNFSKLAEQGAYRRIETTYPAISPVAWSSFSTGTNPGKHNIFDFLDRDLRSYLPKLSSTHIGRLEKFLRIGKFRIPLKKPEIRLLRKSKPFWTLLGERDIWSTILRVPITFPPDKFKGAQLAAMCVPDLLGTQGTFQLLTTRSAEASFKEGGIRIQLEGGPDRFVASLEGPENTFLVSEEPMRIPLTLTVDRGAGTAKLEHGSSTTELELGKLSDWVELSYKAVATVKVHGLTRVQLLEAGEYVSLYVAPINISPEKPAMPVSHPAYYSTYLAKQVGPYATLGLAEDTWALNEKVTDDGTFLQQTYDIENERERMFFGALDRLREGSLVCVFDGTDRIQHMFWRYTEDGHPAAAGVEAPEHGNAIEELYKNNDALVGRVMRKLRDGDLLMVLSDHGFDSFRRGINLNRWLLDHGLLTLKEGADGSGDWLTDVDWSKTKAYALGLAGIFLNLAGREASGIVQPSEDAASVKRQIIDGLRNLRDEECDEVGVNEAFDSEVIYSGPYKRNAPDLIIGYNSGYRTSWDCATGIVKAPLFEDNVKAWSGDHCIDPRLVPGVFFCNRDVDNSSPSLLDVAPTAMQIFGLPVPNHMEGKSLFSAERLEGLMAER